MNTDKIHVDEDGGNLESILEESDRLCEYEKYGPKDSMRLRLLAEETLGLVKGIAGEFDAYIWFEGDKKECRVCVRGRTEMTLSKHDELMAMSFTGKNTLAKGLLGKLREVVELTFMSPGDIQNNVVLSYGSVPAFSESFSADTTMAFQMLQSNVWSLKQYRESLFDEKEGDDDAALAWDELEKSVIGNLADDVQIGINNGTVEITVIRKLENK